MYINLTANNLSGMPETLICTMDNDKNKNAVYAFSRKQIEDNQDNPDISALGDPSYILTYRSNDGKIILGSKLQNSFQWQTAYSNFLLYRVIPPALIDSSNSNIRYRIYNGTVAGFAGHPVGHVLTAEELAALLFAVSPWGQTLETLLVWAIEPVVLRYKVNNGLITANFGYAVGHILTDSELNELLFGVSPWGQTLETLLMCALAEEWVVVESSSLKKLPESEIEKINQLKDFTQLKDYFKESAAGSGV